MEITLKTKKPMTKDEASLLLDLIESRPIISSKETNASSNKVKEEAWVSLTNTFNSKNAQFPRLKEQLKAKWDNLKKAARKRSQQQQMNSKTSGGIPDFIPHDEILDRVAGILGSTCAGFEVPFGGDGTGIDLEFVDSAGADADASSQAIPLARNLLTLICEGSKRKINDSTITPRADEMSIMNKGKKKKYSEDDGRRERNLAICKYYEKKTEKITLEIELLKAELAKKNSFDVF